MVVVGNARPRIGASRRAVRLKGVTVCRAITFSMRPWFVPRSSHKSGKSPEPSWLALPTCRRASGETWKSERQATPPDTVAGHRMHRANGQLCAGHLHHPCRLEPYVGLDAGLNEQVLFGQFVRLKPLRQSSELGVSEAGSYFGDRLKVVPHFCHVALDVSLSAPLHQGLKIVERDDVRLSRSKASTNRANVIGRLLFNGPLAALPARRPRANQEHPRA